MDTSRRGRRADGRSTAAQCKSPYWSMSAADVLAGLNSDASGLSRVEAADRLTVYGPNRLAPSRHTGVWNELVRQFSEPIVMILIGATALSFILGDTLDASIILAIIVLSGLLGAWQEHGATLTVARLLAQVSIEVEVRRDGTVLSVDPGDVVPGDVLVLSAGDLVPCDCRLLTASALQVDEAVLTGETYPRHKRPDRVQASAELAHRSSVLFQGSHVVSGEATAVAVLTGQSTELGEMSRSLAGASPRTSFEQGSTRFGLLLARVTAVLTTVILVVNLVLDRPIIDSVLFSFALAIGVTPQMLPAIIAVSLSTGARQLARARVIVRRLDAIEDLGSMDVLCTDKTGTLTEGAISLSETLDAEGRPSDRVATLAQANAALQTGFANPLDDAILAQRREGPTWTRAGELPFDFERRRLSVLVDDGGSGLLITKGAFDEVLDVCASVATDEGPQRLDVMRSALVGQFRDLSDQGYRVLAVAERELALSPVLDPGDESEMTFVGFLAFQDSPKAGVGETVAELGRRGVRLCMLTGDNQLAAAHIARTVGVADPRVLVGAQIAAMDDSALRSAVAAVDAFAELSPAQKERVIEAFRASGAVVGYLGDGINDAGSLHLADVGISVDTAVDVAKSAADVVLLDKGLDVLVEGVRLGRRTFANTLKYVSTTISANFGNTASMAAASAFLPFLPLLPRQILLLNFLTDLPSVAIADDHVDPEQLERPRRWDVHEVARFMVVFGLLSSAFDLITFAVMVQVFDAGATLFRSAWFVGSTLTEIAVLLVLRTHRLGFRSSPGRALVLASAAVGAVVMTLPYLDPVADPLGLGDLPLRVLVTLVGITAVYVVAAELTKGWFYGTARWPRRSGGARDHQHRTSRQRRLQHVVDEHRRR